MKCFEWHNIEDNSQMLSPIFLSPTSILSIFHIRNKEESQYETVPDITPQEEKTITDDVLDDLTETTDVTEGTDGVTEATTEAVAEVSGEATEKATEVTAGPVL